MGLRQQETRVLYLYLILMMGAAWPGTANATHEGDCNQKYQPVTNGDALTTSRWNGEWENVYMCAQDLKADITSVTAESTNASYQASLRVLKSGDNMTGSLNFTDASCETTEGHACYVDNVDVSVLNSTVVNLDTTYATDVELSTAIGNLDPNGAYVDEAGDNMTGSLTFYNGTINTAAISASGTAAFSGDVGVGGSLGVGGTLAVNQGQRFHLDGGTNDYLASDLANNITTFIDSADKFRVTADGIAVNPGNKFRLDSYTGNDYIYQPSTDNDTIAIYTSESLAMVFNESRVVVGTQRDFVVQQGKSFYLDGGTNDYLKIDLANNITTFIDGVDMLRVTSAGIAVNPGKVINLDGGGNDYIYQSASDTVSIHAGEFNVATFDGNGNGKFSTQVQVFMPGVGTNNNPTPPANFAPAYISTLDGQVIRWTSSIQFKENITPIDFDTENVFELEPVSFDYKHPENDNDIPAGSFRDFGLLAEQVDTVLPEIAIYDADGNPYSVRYDKLSVLLLQEMKKMKSQIIELEEEVSRLKKNQNLER